MIPNNIINNVDIDKLPEIVQVGIIEEFKTLPVQEKLIIYTKLTHGNLFKAERKDLFNLNKVAVNKLYDQFIERLKLKLANPNES